VPIGRRRFIGLLAGAAAAGTAAGGTAGRVFSSVLASADQPLYPPRGPENFVLSVCAACPGGCGLRVRRIGERVVKVEGNPLHPISGGRVCVKGQAALEALYHPDRVRKPLRRAGPRGSLDSFKPASWDQALSEISGRLAAIRNERRPESLVILHGNTRSAGVRLFDRFAGAYGTPNFMILHRGDEADALALDLTQGVRAVPAYDLRAADYVLSFGCEFLEASPSPVFTSRAYGDFRQTRAAHRGKLVHIDPRLSVTAASADEWIPIRHGTHGIFALGVAAVMVAEGLYDREFVTDRCEGFEEGLRPLLEERFALESVADQTGVSVNTILRIAREFAGSHSIALGPRKGPLLPGRAFDHLAAHVLNALAGNIDQPGGLLVPDVTPIAVPDLPKDAVAQAGTRQPRLDGRIAGMPCDPEQLAEAIVANRPYRAEVLIMDGVDPVYATAGDRFRAAIDRVPTVVSFATVPNDTALYSDWILPETHFLEQADLHTTPTAVPFASASVASAALTPSPDVRPVAGVVLDIAQRLHLGIGEDVDKVLRAELDGLVAARRGAIVGTSFDEAWVRMMEGAGWWSPGYKNEDELWERAHESGGWWDPFYDHGDWNRVLRTKSGRFELRADLLRQLSENPGQSPRGQASLALLLFEPLATAGGTGAELPFLQSLLHPGRSPGWHTWGEIHPETAKQLGVRDGRSIRVSSQQASIVVTARVTPNVVPGVIAIPLGLGRFGGGRWATGMGANPLRLAGGGREAISGLPDFESTRVVITKAEGIA